MAKVGPNQIPDGKFSQTFRGDPSTPTTVPKQWAIDLGTLLDRAKINHGSIDTQDPIRGMNIKIPDQILSGGPFYPSVYIPTVKASLQANDKLIIGEEGEKADPSDTYYYKPGRSATTPGILMVSGIIKSFTTEEPVDIFTAADTRLLTIKTVISGATMTVTYPFYTLAQVTDGTTLKDWKDVSGNVHFPLGWVTVAEETRGTSTKWRVQQITWPCTEWVLQGGGSSVGGGICVQITSQVTYQHYKCLVFGNGYRDDTGATVMATATGQDLWIDQIAAGSTIPTGTRLRATKVLAHYEADVPRWL